MERLSIEVLIEHPDNPNRMTDDDMAKLRRNIDRSGGRYPPIIVRSLELSERWAAEHAEGLFQILDGKHRKDIAVDKGDADVECVVWDSIDDTQAGIFLATLNRLHGEDDAERRSSLIRKISDGTGMTPAALADLLPESAKALEQHLEIMSDPGLAGKHKAAAESAQGETAAQILNIWCEAGDKDVIKEAIAAWLSDNDPDRALSFREGVALAAICRGES